MLEKQQEHQKNVADRWVSQLRANGYRLTDSRRALVEILVQSKKILNAEQLCDLASQRHPDLGRATVYRTLEKLIELGLVQRVHDQYGCHSYLALLDDDPQALLICSDCHRVAAAPSDMFEQVTHSLEEATGYSIQKQVLQFSGMCADCQ